MAINPEIEKLSAYNYRLMKANVKLITEFVIAGLMINDFWNNSPESI
jgi:hypothetical protein